MMCNCRQIGVCACSLCGSHCGQNTRYCNDGGMTKAKKKVERVH